MSPLLIALFIIADIEEFLYSKGLRGVSLKYYLEIIMLASADDMVFLADSPVWFKRILKFLKEYFEANGLEVNLTEAQIIRFQKEGYANKNKLSPFLFKILQVQMEKVLYVSRPYIYSIRCI